MRSSTVSFVVETEPLKKGDMNGVYYVRIYFTSMTGQISDEFVDCAQPLPIATSNRLIGQPLEVSHLGVE